MMKKLTVLGILLLAAGSIAFADDAKTMPIMTGRFYAAPSFTVIPGEYDTDGKYHRFDDSAKIFNLGFVLEYGVIDWITAAIQWAPGWTAWSDVTPTAGPFAGSTATLDTNGLADLFVGAKIQIVGEKAPVQNDTFRFAVAAGITIPLPGPDFSEELSNVMAGKKATINSMDKHVFAIGGRLYFDWIIRENFFINLYNETVFYPVKQDLIKDGIIGGALGSGTVNYKYKLTFELEPVFSKALGSGIDLGAGIPVNFRYIPEYEYSVPAAVAAAAGLKTDPQYLLSINPNISLFLKQTPLPLELKLQYNFPVLGNNTQARHTVIFQIKAYFALPGRP